MMSRSGWTPQIPTDLQLSVITGGVRLTWSSAERDYTEIWRSIGGGTYTLITVVAAGIYTYDDTISGGSVDYKIRGGNHYEYSSFSNIYGIPLSILFTTNGATAIEFELQGTTGATASVIYWGDGSSTNATLNNAIIKYTKTVSAGVKYITVTNAASYKGVRLGYDNISNCEGNISAFNSCTNLELLGIYPSEGQWTGSINGINKGLITLYLDTLAGNTISGDVTPFTSLETLKTNSPLTGNCSNTIPLKILSLGTSVGIAITCNITLLVNIIEIDSYAPNSWIGGDLTNHLVFKHLCVGATPNEFYGDIATCPNWEYLDNYGDSYIHGDISGLIHIYRFLSYNCSNAFTGSLANLTELGMFSVMNDLSTITKPARLNNNTKVGYLQHDNWNFSAAEITTLAADVLASKDIAKTSGNAERTINFSTNGSSTPTGQGATDITTLRAYRSPSNNVAYSLWTILTN